MSVMHVLAAVLAVLAAVLGPHLAAVLLPVAGGAACCAVVILSGQIARTVIGTGWGIVPARRASAAW